ncbi:TenA family transcriptional regulator [Dyella solisilvae]|uniref:TenA family transcriptional regulator n=1 Tax=Dyella solisilvae TaxID=1920168 RepID=A0A370K6F9_9GAMM|nr:iron-containing redox enzyme family protein [Dyella solisilvae]RDI98228.1 TenA family transcriptional regulator [Dyella solisilvae]
MNNHFERTGPLTELTSYPQWAQDLVAACEPARRRVRDHLMWDLMGTGRIDHATMRNFMVGTWSLIERFPSFMAQNLLKTQYGRSAGDNLARRWLVRNIRVEQNHAEYWLDWAEGAGVAREEVLKGRPPRGTQAAAEWCHEVCGRDTLAAGIAATNYAIEGVTGDWSQKVYDSVAYAQGLPQAGRKATLRWLQLHAAYDDTHPWEALEIVCTLMGNHPAPEEVAHLQECIERSYVSLHYGLERCLVQEVAEQVEEQAA